VVKPDRDPTKVENWPDGTALEMGGGAEITNVDSTLLRSF
jgi:hypothetical protein